MKCPKCGSEYEGDSCPQCNGPQIVLNDSDYLRRKKEWEEHGKILGVKVRKDEKNPEENPEFKLPEFSKVGVEIKKVKEKVNKNIFRKMTEKLRSKFGKKLNKTYLKKHWIQLVLAFAILATAIIGGKELYKLCKRLNMTMYLVSSDGRICTGGLETKLVANKNDVIFTMDGRSFYEEKIPFELSDGMKVVYSYASEDGKYFTAQIYNNGKYTLYLWNDETVKTVCEGSDEKDVKYISDKGKLLFTGIANAYEGLITNIALYSYDATAVASVEQSADKTAEKGVLTTIEQDVRSEYLYLKDNTLVYLDGSDHLYTLNYSKLTEKKTLIGENIKGIYGISADTDNLYSNSTAIVKPSNKREALIYQQNGKYYYYDIDGKDTTYLFKSTFSGVDIVYEKSQDNVYCINTSSISFGTVKGEDGAELSKLDNISGAVDKCYYPDSSTLVYVNSAGELISVNKGNKTFIRSGVSTNSLNLVRNSDGITYIADGMQYYRSSLSGSEVKLKELAAGSDTSQTLVYKGYLYFMNATGELCSCSLKGKDFNMLGSVTSFWVK